MPDGTYNVTRKRCSKCREHKNIRSFSRNRAQPDGYANQCKECFRQTSSRYYYENGGKERAQERELKQRYDEEVFVKTCTKCGEDKRSPEFYRRSASKDGRSYWCKACMNAFNKTTKGKYRNYESAYAHARHLEHSYRMTPDEYQSMLDAQGGVCAICGNPENEATKTGKVRRLAVDHDHSCCAGPKSCGKCVRGLLCRRCNQTLGRLEEDIPTMRAMIAYIASFKDSSE